MSNRTAITDKAIEPLKSIKGLTKLKIAKTQLTDHGVAELKQTLTGCDIRR